MSGRASPAVDSELELGLGLAHLLNEEPGPQTSDTSALPTTASPAVAGVVHVAAPSAASLEAGMRLRSGNTLPPPPTPVAATKQGQNVAVVGEPTPDLTPQYNLWQQQQPDEHVWQQPTLARQDPNPIGYKPPATSVTRPVQSIPTGEARAQRTAPQLLAQLLTTSKAGSRAPSRASTRISMTSTQLRDMVSHALKEQADEAEEREQRLLEVQKQESQRLLRESEEREQRLLREQRRESEEREQRLLKQQKREMERVMQGVAREAATRATQDTARSLKRQQESSERARKYHEVFASSAPSPARSLHSQPRRSRSLGGHEIRPS